MKLKIDEEKNLWFYLFQVPSFKFDMLDLKKITRQIFKMSGYQFYGLYIYINRFSNAFLAEPLK